MKMPGVSLIADGDPDSDPGGTAARGAPHVGEDERQQEEVDLAQEQRVVHRLEHQASGYHGGHDRPGRPAVGQPQG